MCKNMMTDIFVESMQLTAVLNKVNLSKVLLTPVKHEVFFQFISKTLHSQTLHVCKKYDNFSSRKIPISACLVRAFFTH